MRRTLAVAVLLLGSLAQAQTALVVTGPPGLYSFSCPAPVTIEHGVGFVTLRWASLPPGPTPPSPPTPTPGPIPPTPTPAPIPLAGLRVLILYESADLSRMPAAQVAVLFDPTLRAYLDSTTPLGADGKTHEYRIWDDDVNASGDAKHWQDALARPHGSVPWIIVSNGRTGFEGELPANTADTIALIKRYEVRP